MATACSVRNPAVLRKGSSGHGAWRLVTLGPAWQIQWLRRVASGNARSFAAIPAATARGVGKLGHAQQFQWPRRVASGSARPCAAVPVTTARGVWKSATLRSNSSGHGAWRLESPGDAWTRVEQALLYGLASWCFLSGMCRVPEFWASTSSVESRGFRGTVAALTPSPHWVPCPTERRAVAYTYYTLDTWLTGKRIGAYTFYTLDTVAHGAARVPLHPRGPCAGGWPYAGTCAFRLLGDQSAATQVACAGPREALQNTPHSEQNVPTSLFLPLPRPCVSAHAA